ncbi:hypothetical protein E2C01_085601 [Portunus trituberculatus]|uniref:Uncharacterized protein n=1 Tax=Portunus trituberculatus TaxID=210409 RepID=A0A5B7J9C0_PORTR|nr:hypothetical protein [Portunus trituberculatus]
MCVHVYVRQQHGQATPPRSSRRDLLVPLPLPGDSLTLVPRRPSGLCCSLRVCHEACRLELYDRSRWRPAGGPLCTAIVSRDGSRCSLALASGHLVTTFLRHSSLDQVWHAWLQVSRPCPARRGVDGAHLYITATVCIRTDVLPSSNVIPSNFKILLNLIDFM